jgi:lysophospholipase L1-like esterase
VPELGKNDLSSSDRKEECLMDTDIIRYRKFGPTLGSSIDKINCRVPRSQFNTRVEGFHNLVKKVANDFPYVKIFDPTDIFCDENFCYGYQGNTLLYKDVDHLNAIGSRVLANELVKLIKPSD